MRTSPILDWVPPQPESNAGERNAGWAASWFSGYSGANDRNGAPRGSMPRTTAQRAASSARRAAFSPLGVLAWLACLAACWLASPHSPASAQPPQRAAAEAARESGDLQGKRLAIVAHRGLLLDAPENTLENFRSCLQLGLGFELDVQRSRDGVLVCLHDTTVDRTTNGKGAVRELTLAQLKALDAGGWFAPQFAGAKIPTLEEVFELAAKFRGSGALLAVDFKGDDPQIEADVVQLAERCGVLDSLVMIGRPIGQPQVREKLRAASAQVHVACLANLPSELDAALADRWSDWVYLRFVPSPADVARIAARSKRIFLAGPTVASEAEENWRRCAARGVDAVLTDYSLELARQLRHDRRHAQSLWEQIAPTLTPPDAYRDDLGPYRSVLQREDGSKVATPQQWEQRRSELLRQWHAELGPWPALLPNPRLRYLTTEKRELFTLHQVQVEAGPDDTFVEGHLLVPHGDGPFPAALVTFYDSATSVSLGSRGSGTHDYGLQLAERGIVTLSIGTPGSLESPDKRTAELLVAAAQRDGRQPLSTLAYVAANCHTALANLPVVDGDRIGVVGLSYGGKWAMFASCLYDKFACAVWSDPGIVFNEQNSNVNYWEPWYLGYQPGTQRPPGPPHAERPRTGLYKQLVDNGRDLNELHALMCPRPVLVAGGTEDPPANWRALNHMVRLNRLLGYENRVGMSRRKTHVPTPEALQQTLAFLEYHLKYR